MKISWSRRGGIAACLHSDDTVLDYACGNGITTFEISKSVQKIYVGDTSENMINSAGSKSRERGISNVEYYVSGIFSERFENSSFDVILAFNILYFLTDVGRTLRKIHELLKPGGIFISVTDCPEEKKTVTGTVQFLLSRLGIIAYMRFLNTGELQETIDA